MFKNLNNFANLIHTFRLWNLRKFSYLYLCTLSYFGLRIFSYLRIFPYFDLRIFSYLRKFPYLRIFPYFGLRIFSYLRIFPYFDLRTFPYLRIFPYLITYISVLNYVYFRTLEKWRQNDVKMKWKKRQSTPLGREIDHQRNAI